MKNRRLAILLIALLPILAGCVRLEGNIAIDGSGLVNGKITYSLDKSLASQGGINSLQDLQNSAKKENENRICTTESYRESSTEFIFECNFNGAALTDSDLKVQKIDNRVSFFYKQEGSDGAPDLGKTSLSVNFPGNIISIQESKKGVTVQKSGTAILISASGTASFQVTVLASIQAAPKPSISPSAAPTPDSTDIKQAYSALKNQSDAIFKNLSYMRNSCPVIIKYSNGMSQPSDPKFTGDVNADNAALAAYRRDVIMFQTVIDAKIVPVFKGKECANQKAAAPAKVSATASPSAAATEEEVVVGEVLADYEIKAAVVGNSSTRISIVASPETNVTIIASKKGIKKKISFKVQTDGNGEKSFRTTTNLRGYTLKLVEAGEEVALTTVK